MGLDPEDERLSQVIARWRAANEGAPCDVVALLHAAKDDIEYLLRIMLPDYLIDGDEADNQP